MQKQFPRTEVGGVSMPRLLIGSNWMLGYSHTGSAADEQIKAKYAKPEDYLPLFKTYLEHGIDAVMGLPSQHELFNKSIKYAEDKLQRKIIIIDTPIINVDDTTEARREAEAQIKKSAEIGATFCLLHHSCAEQLVNKNTRTLNRLSDYTKMIRDAGLIPGLSAHMPELVVYSDLNEYDVQTYIQLYNPLGFLMQVEVEYIAKVINEAKKPVMTIKPMAAGRCTPYVGLNFVWNTIRPCDMVTIGAYDAMEAAEDIEISLAAIERRFPDIDGRTSPNTNQDAFGN